MITQPSAARILEVVQHEIAETVLPAVSDPPVVASVQMIQHILSTLAVRADHELAWLVEEIEAIDTLADAVLVEHPDATSVASALDALRTTPGDSLHLSDVSARYSLASEVLSCALEAVPADSPVRAAVEAQLELRLAHEVDIIGDFQLVGRT